MREQTHITIPTEEIARQTSFCADIRVLPMRPNTYCIVTYGCQMNAHDSEKLAGMLAEMGLSEAGRKEDADFVLYNTCCVRDNAERRALGNVTWLKELKKQRPELVIGVCGCMIQQDGMADKILGQYPFVDIAFGTHNLHRFPELLYNALSGKRRVVEVLQADGCIAEDVPMRRVSETHAYITIMYGCNNFCSYCIVPYVRGRERSRDAASILAEAKALQQQGVQEIMLLGQNVNSYGNDLGEGRMTFPQLLRELDQLDIPRIRFMTSHPKDLSDELIDVMASARHVCPALHLPVQAGSDAVLSSMRRGYTRAQYLARVAELRRRIPDIALTTDLIVAYPGETEQDFADTLSLVEQVRYDAAFTFIYSPRKGTKAAELPGRIDDATATRRIEQLIAVQRSITATQNARFVGTVQPVLVEEQSKRSKTQLAGKTPHGITVNFTGDARLIGTIIDVAITGAAETTLRGELATQKTEGYI